MIRPSTRGLVGLTALALAASGAGLLPAGAASAAPDAVVPFSAATSTTAVTVDDATFAWDLNNESTSGAFAPNTWNLMSAGRIGDPGAGGVTLTTASGGQSWSNGRPAGWSATSGDVTVEDLQADGSYAPATFAGTRTNTAGANANTTNGAGAVRGETRLVFSQGQGTVDPTAGTAQISWDGDATLLFYSGMTFFYLSDPTLTVASDGTGTVTATSGGYATSMDDPTQWNPLPDTRVTVATLQDVEVTATGVETTPAYRQVEYAAPADSSPQNRTAATWGSFPQGFVDFQQQVGQGPYWYSSGGSADPRKVANPFAVSYDATATPQVTVSKTSFLPTGAQQVTVEGSGFDPAAVPAARPPLAGSSGGVYVAVGKFAPTWRPSAGAPSSSRVASDVKWAVLEGDVARIGGAGAGAVPLREDGTFSATLTVDKEALDAKATAASLTEYGIYTYPGGGAVEPSFETATPLSFATPAPPEVVVPPEVALAAPQVTLSAPTQAYGRRATAVVGVRAAGTDGTAAPAAGTVTLSRAGRVLGTAALTSGSARFDLGVLPAGRHTLQAAYSGTPTVATGTQAATLVVSKATTTTRTRVDRRPTVRRPGRATISVTSPSTKPTGRVTVQVRRANGTLVRTVRPALSNGSVSVVLPKARRAGYRLVVTYPGSADVAGSSVRAAYRIG